ncbi:MAG: hypothetical protein NWR73_06330 [Flavobacteriales bacterium]|nr:hypothetical protein [Flavobacteriales bacterium]
MMHRNSHKSLTLFFSVLTFAVLVNGCKKDEEEPIVVSEPNIIFRFAFDASQPRLNNLGNPSSMPAGHAAQTPSFNSISANYLELTPSAFTALGMGEVLYNGPQTSAGGDAAIDFDQARILSEGQNFVKLPISDLDPGTYTYARVSLSYQNFNVDYRASGLDLTGTLASFVGFNNYINSYTISSETVEVNANKLQGYWGFETFGNVFTGQAPAGATTVVNPIWATSPVPAGSCVVTGEFASPLVITGNETSDIIVTLSLSTNQSFEWVENTVDGKYEPGIGEQVVDMGIRGMIPSAQ